MCSAECDRPAGRAAVSTIADAAQVAAASVEARWPDTSVIVLWRAEGGAEAINRDGVVHIRSLDVTSDTAVIDSVVDALSALMSGRGADSFRRTDARTDGELTDSVISVPLLVDGQREGLLCVVGLSPPLHDSDEQWLGGIASLLATVRDRDLRLEHATDEAETFRREARTDLLTGLLNRRGFLAELDAHCAHATAPEYGDILLLADVRGLKEANDRHGHAAGDRLLIDVSDALRATTLPHDVLGRFGGDEFAVVMCGAAAAARASKYAAEVQLELDRAAAQRPTLLRVGFGTQDLSGVENSSQALQLADNAMFRRPS